LAAEQIFLDFRIFWLAAAFGRKHLRATALTTQEMFDVQKHCLIQLEIES
jgi:hypothetical protein